MSSSNKILIFYVKCILGCPIKDVLERLRFSLETMFPEYSIINSTPIDSCSPLDITYDVLKPGNENRLPNKLDFYLTLNNFLSDQFGYSRESGFEALQLQQINNATQQLKITTQRPTLSVLYFFNYHATFDKSFVMLNAPPNFLIIELNVLAPLRTLLDKQDQIFNIHTDILYEKNVEFITPPTDSVYRETGNDKEITNNTSKLTIQYSDKNIQYQNNKVFLLLSGAINNLLYHNSN